MLEECYRSVLFLWTVSMGIHQYPAYCEMYITDGEPVALLHTGCSMLKDDEDIEPQNPQHQVRYITVCVLVHTCGQSIDNIDNN